MGIQLTSLSDIKDICTGIKSNTSSYKRSQVHSYANIKWAYYSYRQEHEL